MQLFSFVGPYRADLSGRPLGFLLMWRPQPDSSEYRYRPIKCAWSVGIWWFPFWWHERAPLLPRLKFAAGQPAQ